MIKIVCLTLSLALSTSLSANDNLCPKQMITAINPTTNSIVDFPTACDVPAGWILLDDSHSFKSYQLKTLKAWKGIKDTGSNIKTKWDDSQKEREELRNSISDFYSKLVE